MCKNCQPCCYSCGQKFTSTFKAHLYIIEALSSNDIYSSKFSVMESQEHILLGHKNHSWIEFQ